MFHARICSSGLLAALVFASQTVSAFVNPPVLVPTDPIAGQPISISVTSGVCDVMGGVPAQVTVQGSSIHALLQSGHSDDVEFCTFPTFTSTYAIGQFASGSYTLQADRTYVGANGSVTENIGIIVFGVTAIATTPTLDAWAQALLLVILMGVALLALRRHSLHMSALVLASAFLVGPPLARAVRQETSFGG